MANAVQEALNRASQSQGFKESQETFKAHNVSLAADNPEKSSAQNMTAKAATVEEAYKKASSQDKQTVEAAKPQVTSIENADKVTPQHTPSQAEPNPKGLEDKTLDPETKDNIERVGNQAANDNTYPNAVDRANSRATKEPQKIPPEPEKER